MRHIMWPEIVAYDRETSVGNETGSQSIKLPGGICWSVYRHGAIFHDGIGLKSYQETRGFGKWR